MANGVDAYGPIPLSSLGNYEFVGRYVSSQPGKCITTAEANTYWNNHKSVLLVFEDSAYDGLGTTAWAVKKAQVATPVLQSINWPHDRPVHFAFDFSSGLYPNAFAAMYNFVMAFAAGINRPPAIYCDSWLGEYMHQRGVPYIWGFGEGRDGTEAPWLPALVWQGQTIMLNGQTVDPDYGLVRDFGQWPLPALPNPSLKELPVTFLALASGSGSGVVDGTTYLVDTSSGFKWALANSAGVNETAALVANGLKAPEKFGPSFLGQFHTPTTP